MKTRTLTSFAIAVAIPLTGAFAAVVFPVSPFAGKWRFNAAKSTLTGARDSIEAAGPNAWKFTRGSLSWTVKADGTDQPTPFGNTIALKVAGPANWEITNKTRGVVTSAETWILADDGKSMTRTSSGAWENGRLFSDVVTLKRTAGDKGFEGIWESTEIKTTKPEVDIETMGFEGLRIRVPADALKLTLTFDGMIWLYAGPRVPTGLKASARTSGPRKFIATTQLNDTVLEAETWEVSADGKTLTYTERGVGEPKPITSVFDRI